MIDFDMIKNPNKFISKKGAVKNGYKLEDKEEFKIVRDTLVKLGLSTKNFDYNLSKLIINNANNNNTYSAYNNEINWPTLEEDRIHELFHMASNNFEEASNNISGLEQEDKTGKFGMSINKGVTDYLTKEAKKDYRFKYPVEAKYVSFLTDMYGNKVLEPYALCEPNMFYASFGPNQLLVRDFVRELDSFNDLSYRFYRTFEANNIKSMRLASEVTDSFIKSFLNFYDLVAMNEGDIKKYMADMKTTLNTHDNIICDFIRIAFSYSGFGDPERVFNSIVEEIDKKEGLGL